MNLVELYDKIGGDYGDVMNRLRNEDRIKKFLGLFLRDTSFSDLSDGIAAKDWNTAFRGAHTLKGVAANMAFSELYKSACDITEALRGGKELQDEKLFENVVKSYKNTVENIEKFVKEV